LGIAQRTIRVKYDFSREGFSPRKLFPINPKTIGDHLILKRVEADISQAEVAAKLKVSDKTLRAWEYDQAIPSQMEWQALKDLLPLNVGLFEVRTNS